MFKLYNLIEICIHSYNLGVVFFTKLGFISPNSQEEGKREEEEEEDK